MLKSLAHIESARKGKLQERYKRVDNNYICPSLYSLVGFFLSKLKLGGDIFGHNLLSLFISYSNVNASSPSASSFDEVFLTIDEKERVLLFA